MCASRGALPGQSTHTLVRAPCTTGRAPAHKSQRSSGTRTTASSVSPGFSRFRMCSLRVKYKHTLMASFACPTPSPQPHCKRHVGALRIAIRCAHNRVPDEWIRHHIKSKSHSALRGLHRQPAIALQNIGTLALTSSLAAPPDLLTPCVCTPFT